MDRLRLVYPGREHEQQVWDYLREFREANSEIYGVGGLTRYEGDYEGWLAHLVAQHYTSAAESDRVSAETFLLMKSTTTAGDHERLVGMVDIRLELTNQLLMRGGHIGYSIRPSERRKGYNKVNLLFALYVCRQYGIEVALLTCREDNIGSEKTMRALGGKLLHTGPHRFGDGPDDYYLQHWYVIDVNAAIEKYTGVYAHMISAYPPAFL